MKIFLDTSLLSDTRLSALSSEIADRRTSGDAFYVSVITHFQLMWGYFTANRSPEKYENLLAKLRVDVAPLTKLDAEEAAKLKPSKGDLLDALISASARRNDATVWATDKDFLKFLPKSKVRIF